MATQSGGGGRQRLGVGVGITLVMVAGLLIAYQLHSQQSLAGNPAASFYSDDDGATWFTDSVYKFPPFDHNGRVAVRAYVFESNGKRFVGLLGRYTPATVKLLRDRYADVQQGRAKLSDLDPVLMSDSTRMNGTEVKLPGPSQQWLPFNQFKMNAIKAPDGGVPQLVSP